MTAPGQVWMHLQRGCLFIPNATKPTTLSPYFSSNLCRLCSKRNQVQHVAPAFLARLAPGVWEAVRVRHARVFFVVVTLLIQKQACSAAGYSNSYNAYANRTFGYNSGPFDVTLVSKLPAILYNYRHVRTCVCDCSVERYLGC